MNNHAELNDQVHNSKIYDWVWVCDLFASVRMDLPATSRRTFVLEPGFGAV